MSAPRYQALAYGMPGDSAHLGPDGLSLTPSGRLSTVSDAASVRQALLFLISTRPGERVNRPAYGCHLFRLAFAPADDTTAGLAIHYVARAVERWERRVDVLAIDAGTRPERPEVLEVRLRYRIRASRAEDEIAVAVPLDGVNGSGSGTVGGGGR